MTGTLNSRDIIPTANWSYNLGSNPLSGTIKKAFDGGYFLNLFAYNSMNIDNPDNLGHSVTLKNNGSTSRTVYLPTAGGTLMTSTEIGTLMDNYIPSIAAQYVFATSFDNLINQVSATVVGGAVFKVTGSTGMPNNNNSWYGFAYSNAAKTYAFVLCMSFATSIYTRSCVAGTWANWRTI